METAQLDLLEDLEYELKKAGLKRAIENRTGIKFKVFEHTSPQIDNPELLGRLLKKCYDVGYDKIVVNAYEIRGFPQDTKSPKGTNREGWPAIWGITEDLNMDVGAGNPGQRQLMGRTGFPLEGVYEFERKEK